MNFRRTLNILLIAVIFCILSLSYLIFTDKILIFTSKINFRSEICLEKKEGNEEKAGITSKTSLLKNKYLNIVNPILRNHSYLKGSLQTPGREVIIYLHFRGDAISNSLLASKTWEGNTVQQMIICIKEHPGIQILDIGCNLGVFTLNAAALGCKVVAVDANSENTDRVVQSLLANGFAGTVFNNAISHERKKFIMDKSLKSIASYQLTEVQNSTDAVETIFMDDLVPFFDKDKKILIKMDIEAKEVDAMKQASILFAERNVIFVIMEWAHIKKLKDISYVIDFFTNRSFKAYNNYQKVNPLNSPDFMNWPSDVYWIK